MNDQAAPSFVRQHASALVASLALTAGFVWVLHAGALPLLPPAGALARLSVGLSVAFVAALVVSMLAKYLRYHFLIAPLARLSMRRLLTISSIGMALVTILPFRLGEFARPAMLREKGRISGWAVTGTVGAERIIDGVAFGLTLLLGLALAPPQSPLPDHIGKIPVHAALVPRVAVFATAGFGVALLVMAVFYWRRSWARELTARLLGPLSPKLGARVADIVTNMSDGFKFLRNPRFTLPYLAVTALSIAAHVWAMVLGAQAVGMQTLSLSQSAVVVGVLALGFAAPNAPGFFGAVQLALYAGLLLYWSPEQVTTAGAALVFMFYVSYIGIVLVLGILGLIVEYWLPGAAAETRAEAEPLG